MVAWQELLTEANAAGSKYDVIRKRHLKALSRYTKRNTIIYYSGWLQKPNLVQDPALPLGISDADKNGFMSAIHKMKREKGLDLILHTPGGDMAATESLIDYLRLTFGSDVRAMIPQIAMSGGTIMALSCKQIIMGKESSIGPIDPQYGGIAANALLAEFERIREEIKEDPANALLWQPTLSKIRPGFITECESALKWAQSMARRYPADPDSFPLRTSPPRCSGSWLRWSRMACSHCWSDSPRPPDHLAIANHARHIQRIRQ